MGGSRFGRLRARGRLWSSEEFSLQRSLSDKVLGGEEVPPLSREAPGLSGSSVRARSVPCPQPGQCCRCRAGRSRAVSTSHPSLLLRGGCQGASSPFPQALDRPVVPKRCRWKAKAVPRSLVRCSLRSELLCPVQMAEDACPRRGLGGCVRRGEALEEAHLPGNFGSQAPACLLNWVCGSRSPEGTRTSQHFTSPPWGEVERSANCPKFWGQSTEPARVG